MSQNRQILLVARPVGRLKESDFTFREVPVPKPGANQILVRNLYISLDPAMRAWVNEQDSYMEAVKLGDVMRAFAIGEVVESNRKDFKTGDKVAGLGGLQDYYVAGPHGLPNKLPEGLPFPLTNFLSVFGITGLTAYFGLLDVADPKPGETVVVSTAAGAVGSIVGQIAKIKGCRVVGIAGSDAKCAWIKNDLGFDAAINYKTQNVAEELRKACPKGIDVYFDNVGGDILNAVLAQINIGARISICGAISQYNSTRVVPGPSNYINLLIKRAKMQGFIVTDYMPRFPEATMQLAQWVGEGKIKFKEDIVSGLENAPQAINKLFDGANDGKLILKP